MAKELTKELMERAEQIREQDLSWDQRTSIELRDIYNDYSGSRENCCLCTKGKRLNFKTKFYKWYDFRM